MKVLQVLFSGLGGHGSVALSMVEADVNRKWDHELVFFGVDEVKPEYNQKCSTLHIPFIGIQKKPGFDIKSERKYYNVLKKSKPDTIILHSINLIIPTFLYALFHKTKLISVEHTPNQVKTRFEWIFSFFISLLSTRVVFLTEVHREEVLKKFAGIYWKPTVVIPNGIDIQLYHTLDKVKDEKVFNIGMMARMSDTKDQLLLIKAFQHLEPNYPNVKLLLAGSGDKYAMLVDYVKKQHLKNVVFLGMLDEQEVISYLNNLHLYVHATLGETMSTSLMQAMSMGLPIVGTDIPGVNNVMKDNENGILVSKNNVEELEMAIIKLIDNESLRKQFGLCSRSIAELELSSRVMFEHYHKIVS